MTASEITPRVVITTRLDLFTWVIDRTPHATGGERSAIVDALRAAGPAWGADWGQFLAAQPEHLIDLAPTRTYIVVRYGSNAANQSRRNRVVIGTVKAPGEVAAKEAARLRWTFYRNQYVEVIDLAGRTRKADRNAAAVADAATQEDGA